MSLHLVPVEHIPKLTYLVPRDNLRQVYLTCRQMEDLCIKSQGIGLSAVQVGIAWKLFVAKMSDGFRYFVDCEYAPIDAPNEPLSLEQRSDFTCPLRNGETFTVEGCLSIPKRYFYVRRFRKVQLVGFELLIQGQGFHLAAVSETVNEPESILIQHEVDHHNNVLISGIGREVALSRRLVT